MKKNIFFVSLVAMMAVAGAHADVASTNYVNQAVQGKEVTADKLMSVESYKANISNPNKYISAPVLDGVIGDATDGLATVEQLNAEQTARETLAERVTNVENDIENLLSEEEGGILSIANGYADTVAGTAKTDAIAAAKTETTTQVNALATGAVAGNTAAIAAMQDEETGFVATANTYTDEAIADLDVEATTGDGVVKQIAQQDGKIVPTKAKVANADIADDAAIAQSKISGLADALAARIPAPADTETSSTGTYVLTYTPGTGYAWESIGRE